MVEWIAWHQNLGFTDFFIADNESDDGTLELLIRLRDRGVIRLHQEPRRERAQVHAYNTMLRRWGKEIDRIAFLDADEFLVSSHGLDAIEQLEQLLAPPDVGAVGINWRSFGSSGLEKRTDGLVIERFERCGPDDHPSCRHIKTYAKCAAIDVQRIHRANLLPGYRYLNTAGQEIQFTKPGASEAVRDGELCMNIGSSELRVHHYAVKSLQEFIEKKQKRGDAMSGPERERGMDYFSMLDLNGQTCRSASTHAEATRRLADKIRQKLNNSVSPLARLRRILRG